MDATAARGGNDLLESASGRRWTAVVAALLLAATLRPLPAGARKVVWTETATLKTKSIYDDDGTLVYQENFDKKTGERVGRVYDIRKKRRAGKKKGKERKAPASARCAPRSTYIEDKTLSLKRLRFRRGPRGEIVLEKNSLIKVRLLDTLSTKTSKPGDRFRFVVTNNLYYERLLLIPRGTQGTGVVKRVHGPRNWGRSGRLVCDFEFVRTVDGVPVRLELNDYAVRMNQAEGFAAGASFMGLVVLGPVGLVGGMFVKGKHTTILAGSEFYLAVKKDTVIRRSYGRRTWK